MEPPAGSLSESLAGYNEFNSQISNVVLTLVELFLVVALVLLLPSFALLLHFLKRHTPWYRLKLQLFVAAFGLVTFFEGFLLVPATLLALQLLRFFPGNLYLLWLNDSIIHWFWQNIFLLVNLSLLLLLPFAYFVHESAASSKTPQRSGYFEALYNLLLLVFLFSSLVYVLRRTALLFVPAVADFLPFAYALISLSGSLFAIVCIPPGFSALTVFAKSLPTFAVSPTSPLHEHLRNEKLSLQRRLQHGTSSYVRSRAEEEADRQRLAEIDGLLRNGSAASAWWNSPRFLTFLSHTLSAVNLLCPVLIVLRTLLALVDSFSSFQPFTIFSNWLLSAFPAISLLSSLLSLALVLFLSVASLGGFLSLDGMKKIRPRPHETSIHVLILHVYLLVLLAAALPIVSNFLGLVPFALMGEFSSAAYVISSTPLFVHFFRLAFISLLLRRLVFSFPFLSRLALLASRRISLLASLFGFLLRPLLFLLTRLVWPLLRLILSPLLARLYSAILSKLPSSSRPSADIRSPHSPSPPTTAS